jgi:hypothetical protein
MNSFIKSPQIFQKTPWLERIILPLIMPLFLLGLVFLFFPSRERFLFDIDEGTQLMWANLANNGYSLYDQIWIDHPPLFTNILQIGFNLLGFKVGVGRYLVLLFSCVTIWGIFQYLLIVFGKKHAISGTILILLLPHYLRLSVSIMQAIPNICLAILSLLTLIKWHKTQRFFWLIISAIFLSLSIFIKLFTLFFAPIFIIGIFVDCYTQTKKQKLRLRAFFPVFLWTIVLATILIIAGYVFIGIDNLDKVLGIHLMATSSANRQFINFKLFEHLRNSTPFLILGILGAIIILQERRWLALYPLAWMLSTFIFLNFLSPVYYHYIILITIPAAILGTIPFYKTIVHGIEFFKALQKNSLTKSTIQILSVIGIVLLFIKVPEGFSVLEWPPSLTGSGLGLRTNELRFLNLISNYAPETNWIVTDRPMFAARARLLVPPELAAVGEKRIKTGLLSEDDIINIIEQYNPEQIFLGRYSLKIVETHIAGNYHVIHSFNSMKLYLRNDLK